MPKPPAVASTAIIEMALAVAEAAKAGRWDVVENLSSQLTALRNDLVHAKHVDRRSLDVQGQSMTSAQVARRGRAIAAATAGDDELLQAIAKDKRWGSGNVYARKRLHISPGSFTNYRTGKTATPRDVQEKVDADFPKLRYRFPRVVE